MTGTTYRDAMFEVEGPIYEALDHANALQCFCQLTLVEDGHVLSDEQKAAFIHLIGENYAASGRVATEWSNGWNAAVNAEYAEPAQDPMLALVIRYGKGVATYGASGDLPDEQNEALAAATWRASYDRLCTAPPAPTTNAGAIEAIRLVRKESVGGGYQPALIENVLTAVTVFLEGRAAA
ncbi:hypothetical protein GTW51_18940 [Aurantimonas aggregata]|uniref:Uncharacterized protein n=1 Tax=Aurantimonas aggregata TaxID=2047720 RepID=A0A6L9MM32_9HYPH|nr:hypothetical protein [Aurantimonas aggregata]NDV88775.1 hypothetical protein [Aurantimonas aggregata]